MTIKSNIWNWILPSHSNILLRYSLLFFIGIDIAFILLHLSLELAASSVPESLSITKDGSFPEVVQYVKYGIICIVLGRLAFKGRSPLYGTWACLFAYLLLDDWLTLHERGGLILSRVLVIPDTFFLRGQDFGELIITGSISFLIIASILFSHIACKEPQDRDISRLLAVLLGLLAICGVGFDMVQVAVSTLFRGSSILSNIFALLEDGGELIIGSLIARFAIQIPVIKYQVPEQTCKLGRTLQRIEANKRT